MDQELMPIGRFARRCRLSVKQLRHSDELGLLRPAWVDPDSGYRYYRAEQAREALSIGCCGRSTCRCLPSGRCWPDRTWSRCSAR